MERKTEAVLTIDATTLIENLSMGVYAKTPNVLQNLEINFTNADADTEFEKVIALLQEKGLSRYVTKLTSYGNHQVKLSKLPSNIGTLTGLTQLNLNSNKLTTLAGIGQLTGLTSLAVGDNALTTLVGIEQLTGLTELIVAENPIKTLAGIEQLKALTTLGIGESKPIYVDGFRTTIQVMIGNSAYQIENLPIILGSCAALTRVQLGLAGWLDPKIIKKLKAQFLNLQQVYLRYSDIKNLLSNSVAMPSTIREIIFAYNNIPDELKNLSKEELDMLEESVLKDTKTQKKIDNVEIITGLHEAIKNNNFEAFQKLLFEAQHMSINLNVKIGDANYTLLHAAILHNVPGEFTRLLLNSGANPNQADGNGYTPVATAVVQGNGEILATYQQHEPQKRQKFFVPITPETWRNAARRYDNIKDENPNGGINYKEVRDILEKVLKDLGIVLEQSVEKQNIDVQLQLLSYIRNKDDGNFRKILAENPNIDLNVSVKGTRLLHAATANNVQEIVKLLLQAGANPRLTITDSEGQAITPVHIAADKNLQNMLNIYQKSKKVPEEILKDAHRIAQIKQKRRIEQLFDAIANKQFELFESILSKNPGIDLDVLDSEHRSLLHAASRANVPSEFAQKLLEAGADPNIKSAVEWQGTRASYSPLDIAVGEGRADLIPFYQISKIPLRDKTWQNVEFMMHHPYKGNNQSSDADYPKTHELVRGELARVRAKASPFPVIIHTPKEKPDSSSEQKIKKEDMFSNKKITP